HPLLSVDRHSSPPSLHDALPSYMRATLDIWINGSNGVHGHTLEPECGRWYYSLRIASALGEALNPPAATTRRAASGPGAPRGERSEEHTSELQSPDKLE